MLKVAHEDEISALTKEIEELSAAVTKKEQAVQEMSGGLEDVPQLRRDARNAEARAAAAETAREEMTVELASHREKHEALLQKLLAEQRDQLSSQLKQLKAQLASESQQRHASDVELSRSLSLRFSLVSLNSARSSSLVLLSRAPP